MSSVTYLRLIALIYIVHPMCRADLNFEVDFGVNGAIGAIMTKWDLIVF